MTRRKDGKDGFTSHSAYPSLSSRLRVLFPNQRQAVLAGLEPRDRLLIRLRFDDELPISRIAQVLHLPTVFHVYRRLNQVLREIRTRLVARGIDGE